MTIQAWHFSNGYIRNDPDTKIVPGLHLSVDPDRLKFCEYGLHGNVRLIDALRYMPGAVLSQVKLSGRILEDTNKYVASERTHIAVADVTRTLHEFAIWCAEQALALIDNPDPRSLEALRNKQLWLDGKVTDDELAVAENAAKEAAWAVARAVARAARAARVAVSDAAKEAAWAAARAAASDAAEDVVEDAASAARAAASDTAWAAQNNKLTAMVMTLPEFQGLL